MKTSECLSLRVDRRHATRWHVCASPVQSTFDAATNRATFIGTGAPTYDAGGRMITDAITTNTYSYDAEGRLTGVTNTNGASATYQYNALGQLVEQNEYNWDGDANLEILYDAFGRRFGDYDYVSSRHFNVDEWSTEYFPYDADAGMYKGPPTSPDFGLYNIFNNLLGSMRYDGNSGDSARNMGLYNPQGNDWETCTSVLGYSNYAGFDPHCSCWDKQWYIGPDGRPYDFSTGRWMGPQAPGSFDPDNLNPYSYAGNDPINNVDSGSGDPTKPPLPGTDQPPIPLPPGKNGQPNSWRPVPGTTDRPTKWVPQYPVPSDQGGQPSASWDEENGHWDYDNGQGDRTRFDPNGNPVTHPMSITPYGVAAAAAAALGYAASYAIEYAWPALVF